MPAQDQFHQRTQSLLLISKLLDCRDNASPFTLVIDSIEQSAKPLLQEYLRRARVTKTRIIYISFETLQPPQDVDVFITAHDVDFEAIEQGVKSHRADQKSRSVVIIDSLYALVSTPHLNISGYLSSFISPTTSLVAVYHSDIPVTPRGSPYVPHALKLLRYLATTILTTHALPHVLAQKAARDRSLIPPVFGLAEDVEGLILSLSANDERGMVLEMEHRRKSGRGVGGRYFLASPETSTRADRGSLPAKSLILLADHPLYRTSTKDDTKVESEKGDLEVSFDLNLTDKQRADRERVVLPYLDAQRDGGMAGPGEGGRILYDLGNEDDFDEEEDEI